MLAKPLDEITAADLEALIRDRAEETQRLEFKREADLTKDADKKEFAKDVSGMANAAGGRIVYGIAEGTSTGGRPVAEKIIPLTDRKIIDRANNILSDAIVPPVRARIRPIDIEGGFVMVIDIPPSDYHVHMVGAYGESRYYIRTEKSVVPMPEIEVRRAYERIGQLRHDGEARVRRIVETETAFARGRFTTLMIPLAAPLTADFDVAAFNDVAFWLNGPRKPANLGTVRDLVFQLKPNGAGVQAHLRADDSFPDAAYVLRLRRDGVLHLGSTLASLTPDDTHLHEMRLLFDLFNACTWIPRICQKTHIKGPVRTVGHYSRLSRFTTDRRAECHRRARRVAFVR